MRHYPVGIDLDGVTVNFMGALLKAIAEEYPHAKPLTEADITDWEFLDKTPFGTWGHLWRLVRRYDVFRRAMPYPRAIEAINFIGHNVGFVFVTGRPLWAVDSTYAWLQKWGLGDSTVFHNGMKGEVECSVYVEDGPPYLAHLKETRPESILFRMVRPWNRPIEGVRDIHGWDSLAALRVVTASTEANYAARSQEDAGPAEG